MLARKSLFKRKAAGLAQRIQLIAANIETLFIVTSCNDEFNVARLERYLALAAQAGVTPVVVLTKADLADDAGAYSSKAARLMPGLLVEHLDARDAASCDVLHPWCGIGQTVALVGSSGVGKSTLVNTLLQDATQATSGIREHDAHGRHTTTGRSLHRLKAGGWLLDTPGMRELQLADSDAGIDDVFADIAALARECRFSDCRHESEPGCAIQAALEDGRIDAERLRRYRKLAAEDARNSQKPARTPRARARLRPHDQAHHGGEAGSLAEVRRGDRALQLSAQPDPRLALEQNHVERGGGVAAGERRHEPMHLAAVMRLVIEEMRERGGKRLRDVHRACDGAIAEDRRRALRRRGRRCSR